MKFKGQHASRVDEIEKKIPVFKIADYETFHLDYLVV